MPMGLGLGVGLSFVQATGEGGAPPVLLTAPYYDDFSGGADTTLDGRTIAPFGGAAWVQEPANSGNLLSLQITAAGKMIGSQGGSNPLTGGWVAAAASDQLWVSFHSSPLVTTANGGINTLHQVTEVATDSFAKGVFYWSAVAGTGTLGFAYATSGALNGTLTFPSGGTAARVSYHGGDTLSVRKRVSGASTFYDLYVNGWKVHDGVDVSSLPAFPNNAGLRGDLSASSQLDDFEMGDPATQAMISVRHGGKTASRKLWAGSDDVLVRLAGEYTLAAPSGLTATVYNSDTGAAITGYSAVSISNFTASGGLWSGDITIAAADAPDSLRFHVRVERTGLAGSAAAYGFTPVLRPGYIIGGYGQSLMTEMWQTAVSGVVFTPPANSWSADGGCDGSNFPTVAKDRRVHAANTTSTAGNSTLCATYMLERLANLAGHSNFTFLRGGKGGTTNTARLPNDASGIFSAFLEGLDLARDCSLLIENGGTYEVNDAGAIYGGTFNRTQMNTYKTQLDTIVSAIETAVGHSIKVILCYPPAIDNTGKDTQAQNVCRAKWELTQEQPSRYILGPSGDDLQHKAADQYHLVATAFGYPEEARRFAYSVAKLLGDSATDRTGPKLHSVTAWSDTSVTVRFNKNGASALEIVNTAATLADLRGGLTFATDTAFASEKVPTAVSAPSDIDSTYAELTWTFASGSFPTKPYVRGPYGMNPFNRTNNATVNAAKQTECSMVRGVFATEPTNIPVQRYFSGAVGSEVDYIAGA